MWFKAKVRSSPSAVAVRRLKMAPALLSSTSIRGSAVERRGNPALLGEQRQIGEQHRHARTRAQRASARVGGGGPRRIAPDDDKIGAQPRKLFRGGQSYARGAAGDDAELAGKIRHVQAPAGAGAVAISATIRHASSFAAAKGLRSRMRGS